VDEHGRAARATGPARAVLHLSLAGLAGLAALALLAAAVTTVQRRLERPVPGDLLAADPPGEAFRSLGGFGCP